MAQFALVIWTISWLVVFSAFGRAQSAERRGEHSALARI